MVSCTLTPEYSHYEDIRHLRWQARAIASLLSAVHLLSEKDQKTTLDAANNLTLELCEEVTKLARGVA